VAEFQSKPAQEPLRILELFQPADGGVPEHVRVLTEGLLRRGHEVWVCGPPDAALRPQFVAHGAHYEPASFVGKMSAPVRDASTLRTIARVLRDQEFDVVHAHGQKAGVLGRLAARRMRVPAVYTPHSFVYRTQLRRPVRMTRVRYLVTLAVERSLGRHTALIVACSRDEREGAITDRIVPPERIEVVNYGVAPDLDAEPDPQLQRFRGAGPLLGFVATLRDQKGLPTLLGALELLAARNAAPRFAIVGNGPLRNEVERRVAAGGLTDTTLVAPFAGRVEPYLKALDAFVLPSYWEGMPIAVLEAMAMGLPVVASAVDGTPEAIEEGETGYLVPAHDPAALANRLEAVAADPAGRTRIGDAARAEAQRRFGVERMVDEIESLYARVVGT
jgi:glycosyltransferase involved in cell wall biosynthesis